MKKNKSLFILLGIGVIVLLSSFKKKTRVLSGKVYIDQTDAPAGTSQVYSKEGTNVYDRNMNIIYTFDTANLGMTVTGSGVNGTISIVYGDTFYTGLPGFVYSNDIQTI